MARSDPTPRRGLGQHGNSHLVSAACTNKASHNLPDPKAWHVIVFGKGFVWLTVSTAFAMDYASMAKSMSQSLLQNVGLVGHLAVQHLLLQ